MIQSFVLKTFFLILFGMMELRTHDGTNSVFVNWIQAKTMIRKKDNQNILFLSS